MAFFCKSYENVLIWVFLHAEFISVLKTEPKSMVFEKQKKKKNIYHHYFLFFVIFSKTLKQKCLSHEAKYFSAKMENPMKMCLFGYFVHAEFISVLKTMRKCKK